MMALVRKANRIFFQADKRLLDRRCPEQKLSEGPVVL